MLLTRSIVLIRLPLI